ncbi:discoidin domain-containing protein [Dysgonomonas reticulitermitis]
MNMKNKSILYLVLSILFCGFFSCTDKDDDPRNEIAQLSDVVLKQTINGSESLDLTEINTELIFVSRLTFNEKSIQWPTPALEQAFNKIFDLSEDDISVTDAQDSKVSSVNITIDDKNNVKVAFTKVAGSYGYMESSTFKISIKTRIRADASSEELKAFNDNGFSSQSLFYGESSEVNLKSNTISIISKIDSDNFYDVKGDPKNSNYPYKLNVVYFVPSDIQENPGYKKRISTLLLKHQLFICKWMKHWGYEEKSFGLFLDENGMVEIIVVPGEGKKADYPYASNISAGKMINEINQYYTDNKLTKYSEHILVITATNGDISETPFYGYGRWCFALDYPGMSYDLYNIDPITNAPVNSTPLTTSLIGGLFHELGHGLNAPHVGPTFTQKNDPAFGMSLMGAGNQTYGKIPTFMHPATAAIMNNCQVSSLTNKKFYEVTTASVKINGVTINGNKCTIKGDFTASANVTDVIVRFYNATEAFLGGSSGYTSVAFVAKPTGNNFELTMSIEELRVNNFEYRIGATILMENGTTKSTSLPYVYRLVTAGSSYTLESEDIINNGDWSVTTSHPLPKDDAISNAPGSLVDGDLSTCLSMVKPGKSYEGVSVPQGAEVYAIIDFKKQIEFNTIILTNRNFQIYLNAKEVSFYGSNDGNVYTPVKIEVDLPDPKENIIALGGTVKCQYLKMTFDKWDSSQGSTIQFAELGLKNQK